MSDLATPNLPSRDLAATATFYARVGFTETYRDEGWMILERGSLRLEFFAHPELDPATSWFSCCLRLDDVDDFFLSCREAGVPETTRGFPRIHRPQREDSGRRIGALVDPEGSLLRLLENA